MRAAAIEHGQMLAGLDATTEFADIDYESVVNEIAELQGRAHSSHGGFGRAGPTGRRAEAGSRADHRRRT